MARGRKKKSQGLGDTVEKITEATGIKKLVHFIAGEDCGCEERKEKLNKLFPYQNPECLTEDEHTYLTGLFSTKITAVSHDTQSKLIAIYNRVFHAKKKHSSCSPCVNSLINQLRKVYDEYPTKTLD